VRQGLVLLVAIVTACASASPPPGGPEDKAPPQLLKATPDTNAVNVTDKHASFYFDETVNDRGTGAQEIDPHFLVSPSDGLPHVEWHRSRIDVSPRHGFKPNTAYSITMLPGLTDLRNNVMKSGFKLVFSTGPTIPPYRIKGVIFDWIAERPATQAYLEAVSADSVVYLAESDTTGFFEIGPLTPGTYLLRGFIDANANRILDRAEPFDTVHVTVPQPAQLVELLAAPRDTLAARISTVEVTDSLTLKVTFDHPVDPTKPMTAEMFRLVAADSSVIPIAAVLNPQQQRRADSVAQVRAADSLRRADSLAGKPVVAVTPPAAPAPGAKAPPPAPLKPSRPAPYTAVTIKVGKALIPNKEYRIGVSNVYSLGARTQPSERRFTTPKPPPPPPPPKDSTAAKAAARDTTVKPPATPPVSRPPHRR
jgi:hypothetical protein